MTGTVADIMSKEEARRREAERIRGEIAGRFREPINLPRAGGHRFVCLDCGTATEMEFDDCREASQHFIGGRALRELHEVAAATGMELEDVTRVLIGAGLIAIGRGVREDYGDLAQLIRVLSGTPLNEV